MALWYACPLNMFVASLIVYCSEPLEKTYKSVNKRVVVLSHFHLVLFSFFCLTINSSILGLAWVFFPEQHIFAFSTLNWLHLLNLTVALAFSGSSCYIWTGHLAAALVTLYLEGGLAKKASQLPICVMLITNSLLLFGKNRTPI